MDELKSVIFIRVNLLHSVGKTFVCHNRFSCKNVSYRLPGSPGKDLSRIIVKDKRAAPSQEYGSLRNILRLNRQQLFPCHRFKGTQSGGLTWANPEYGHEDR